MIIMIMHVKAFYNDLKASNHTTVMTAGVV